MTSSSSTLSFSFSGDTNESLGNEFYGLDNVSVRGTALGVSTVPLPSAAPMFRAALLALAGLGYAAKRIRNAAA